MKKIKAVVLLLVTTLVLAGCAGTTSQIGSNVTLCCPGNYADYSAYGLQTIDLPLFLRDYVIAEFEEAFQDKGLERNDQVNDLRVVIRYNHINLTSDQEEIDPFVRIEALEVELNYIAQIEIEMFETSSNTQVWGGSISRIHQVVPGEYMHEDRARPAFTEAFRTVLTSYPPMALLSPES